MRVHPHVFRSVLVREPAVTEYQVHQTGYTKPPTALRSCSVTRRQSTATLSRRALSPRWARSGPRPRDDPLGRLDTTTGQRQGESVCPDAVNKDRAGNPAQADRVGPKTSVPTIA
jgi:hypothetical protein